MLKYVLNCWETLKPYMPQRKDEISLSAKAMKIERNIWMVQG